MSADEPFLCAGMPVIDAKFKAWAEDFIVEEVPLYPPLGTGNHLYLWIEKTRLTTPEVAQGLSEATGAKLRDIGYAGMKDKQGVTRQWFSLPMEAEPRLARFRLEGAKILETTRHRNKLRTGHLKGNRFLITLRGQFSDADLASAQAILARLAREGLPNYYGQQRFTGLTGHLKRAEKLLEKAPPRGLHWEEKFSLQVLQSAIFNSVLSARLAQGLYGTMLAGDLAITIPYGGLFRVDDAAEAQTRRDALAIVASGPQPGPEMRHPEGAGLEFESAALRAAGWDALDFSRAPLPGTRRPFAVPLEKAEAALDGGVLRVSFGLPSGAYATNVVRELLGQVV